MEVKLNDKSLFMTNKKLVDFMKKLIDFTIPSKTLRNHIKDYARKKLELYRLKKIYKYLDQYCDNVDVDVDVEDTTSYQEININQLPIWQLWLQGEENAPEIVKTCLSSIKKHTNKREIIILTKDCWQNYIELPHFIMDKFNRGIITYTHFSDILRICLLEKYGGTWIDATVLLTDTTPSKITDSNFFAFAVPKDSFYKNFHLTSSWFIHAKPNHIIIKSLKYALFNYWKNENTLIDYFLLHLLLKKLVDNNPKLKEVWENTPKISNTAPHALQFSLLDTFNQTALNKIKSNSTIHKLTYKLDNIEKNNTFLKFLLDKKDI